MKVWEVNNGSKVKGSIALRKEGSQSYLKHQDQARCEELALIVNQKLYQKKVKFIKNYNAKTQNLAREYVGSGI